MSRLGILALWLLHFLPLAILAPIGQGIGMLAYARPSGCVEWCACTGPITPAS